MRNSISISGTPTGEDCVQVSSHEDYMPAMRAECNRYLDMLRKRFPNCDRVQLVIHSNPHDFGSYLDISVKYDDNDNIAEQQAYFIENNEPENWTDTEVLTFVPEVDTDEEKSQFEEDWAL